jgi:hypothetical protein
MQRTELVRIFEHDPDLLWHLSPGDAAAACDRTVVPSVVLPPGEFKPPVIRSQPGDLGVLVLSGVLLRRVDVFGRRAVELIGTGDMLGTWPCPDRPASMPRPRPGWR